MENTQIIYDAVVDLYRYKNASKAEVEKLYFLENYINMLSWNKYQIQTWGKDIAENEIVRLYGYLKGDIKPKEVGENKYYKTFLEYVEKILNVDKVYLFMCLDRSVEIQLFPDDYNADIEIKKHVQRVVASDSITPNIGHTYYYEDNKIRTIKFDLDENNKKYVWCLTFKLKEDNSESNLKEFTKARNLLTLRNKIFERLKKDFANNHLADYIALKEKLLLLSNEKTGAHTPFKELKESFDLVYKLTKSKEDGKLDNLFTQQLKLISDSIISKIYVFNIMNKQPEQIDPAENARDLFNLEAYNLHSRDS